MPASQNDPILEALRNISFSLSRENTVNLMVAAQTLKEFRQQKLPQHVQTSIKKRIGERVVIRGPRDRRGGRLILSQWPQDHLVENALPSMVCVVRGAADLQIADYVVHCQTGDFVFYPPATPSADGSRPHLFGDARKRQCDLLWIFPGRLNGQGLECALCHSQEASHQSGLHYWVKNYFLSYLFQELFEEIYRAGNLESTFKLVSTLTFFLKHHIERGNATIPLFHSQPENIITPTRDSIEQALAYINSHLSSNLTIDIVARHICISPSVFKKKFRQQTGQTFNKYVTNARMEKAAGMLSGTELFISEISGLVGITDCQFRRLAHEYWGCTPREFRIRQK